MAIGAVAAGAVRIGSMFARGTGSLLGRGGGMLHKATLKRSKIRRENFVRTRKLNKRLIETRKRREKESMLEASKLGRGSSSGIVKLPGSSFFGKVLNFIGLLFVGWLVNNLPKIIKFVQNLITRIQKLVDSLKSFVKNLEDWFKSIGDIVSAGWSNIKNLDFTDSEGKLKTAMDDLDKAFKGMQTDVEGMKKALTADIKELKETSDDTGGTESSGNLSGDAVNQTKQLLRDSEGFRDKAYWDVNAYRIGYGSDTITDASGNVTSVTASSTVTREQAELDLERRIRTEFMPTVANQLGDDFAKLPASAQAALTSVGYNYGSLPSSVVKASRGGNLKSIANAVEALKSHNGGINARRRMEEANIIRNAGGGGSGGRYNGGGNVVEYITGDKNHPNFEYNGHGRESNYHDHIAFRTLQDKERAKTALRAAGIQVGSEYRPGDPGWHGANLAIDVPGAQWGGSGAIGQREFNGSAKVRQVLRDAGFGGGGLGHGKSMISRSTGRMPDIGYSTGPRNKLIIIEEEGPMPMMQQSSGKSSPVIVMGASLNSIMKRKLLTDLAYT